MPTTLPESVRKQYLDAMGIQTWYDPLIQTADVVESIPPASADSNEVVATETPAHTQLAQETAQQGSPELQTAQSEQQSAQQPAQQPTTLTQLEQSILQCTQCELHASRRSALPGAGNPQADLMIISLAPVDGQAEDVLFSRQQLDMLAAMLAAIGVGLEDVYMTSLVKCQPPQQRAPFTSEMICCDDHLTAQIKLIRPKAIMLLGEQPGQQLLVSQKSPMDLRLRNHQHQGVPVFVSYHPAEVTGSAETKRKVWQDLLQIKKQLMTGATSS